MGMLQIDTLTLISSIVILLSPFILKRIIKGLSKGDAAGIATSLGIFGTFLGVFLGLINFDTSNIQDSIPNLLNGLKTAFLTSIAGMICSIIIKISPKIYGFKDPIDEPDTDADKIINLLSRIEKSIGGDNDSSLVTQIIKLRDKTDTLNTSFREFADKMVADSTQSLIDAIQKVIADFNTQINDQFGENFKQLNAGVEKLVLWQQQHKDHVESMTLQFQTTITSIDACQEQLSYVINKASSFSIIAERLEVLLKNLDTTFVGIDNMAKTIPEVFPQIQDTMDKMTRRFAAILDDAFTKNENMLIMIQRTITKETNDMSAFYQQAKQQQSQQFADLKKYVDNLMVKIQTDTTTTFANFNEQVGIALKNSVESLGRQLTSLSAKFVEDYEPLTESLRKLNHATKQL